MDDKERQLSERRWMLLVWSGTAAVVTVLGIGFAGGVRAAFADNPIAWLPLASVTIPLWLWLRARKAR
jgi:hypothetical protein